MPLGETLRLYGEAVSEPPPKIAPEWEYEARPSGWVSQSPGFGRGPAAARHVDFRGFVRLLAAVAENWSAHREGANATPFRKSGAFAVGFPLPHEARERGVLPSLLHQLACNSSRDVERRLASRQVERMAGWGPAVPPFRLWEMLNAEDANPNPNPNPKPNPNQLRRSRVCLEPSPNPKPLPLPDQLRNSAAAYAFNLTLTPSPSLTMSITLTLT